MTGHVAKKGNRYYVVLEMKDPATGKRKQKWISTGLTRKREAEAELVRIIEEHRRGEYVQPSNMTVKELLLRWLEDDAKLSVATLTYERYESIVKTHLIPHLGGIALKDLAAPMVQRYYRSAVESGLSPTTVRQHHVVFSRAIKRGMQWGLVARNVLDGLSPPKKEDAEVEFWEQDEMTRFLEAARTSPYYVLYAVALGTGMRRGELLALQWKDIDFNEQTITVRRSLVKVGPPPVFKSPKSKSGWRLLPISPQLVRLLRRQRAKVAEDKLRLGERYEDYDLVFCIDNGRPLRANNLIRRDYRSTIEKAGIRYINFHGLRHTHATDLLRRGVHPKIVSERLGHHSITITLDLYSHVTPQMQSDAALAIDDLLPRDDDREGATER